jgi:hypothetical protein
MGRNETKQMTLGRGKNARCTARNKLAGHTKFELQLFETIPGNRAQLALITPFSTGSPSTQIIVQIAE